MLLFIMQSKQASTNFISSLCKTNTLERLIFNLFIYFAMGLLWC